MVDREARDKVAAAARAYMAGEIGSDDFDDRIFGVHDGPTKDRTVIDIVHMLWYHYDDFKDLKIVACRWEWDYFNRLLLILESDAELEGVTTGRRWGAIQAVATCCLGVFAYGLTVTGFRWELLMWTVPLGIVSMLLSRLKPEERPLSVDELARYPFPSVGSMLSVRRSLPQFARRRYPRNMERRTMLGPIPQQDLLRARLQSGLSFLARLYWLCFSPFVLLYQAWPRRETRTVVRLLGRPTPASSRCTSSRPF